VSIRTAQRRSVDDGVGTSAPRPDGIPKVTGAFAFASDLHRDRMLWGATLRSPHPHARIISIDTAPAFDVPGVHAVLTHRDVPGRPLYGMKVVDQPVLAIDTVRYEGEPVAIVGAETAEIARRALREIKVLYETLDPLVDPELALASEAPPVHSGGNVVRHVKIRHGDVEAARAAANVIVTGEYETGMQDQAFLGPESGLAIPREDGGVDLFVASQWLHEDHEQVAKSLGLAPDRVRITLGGVGGAFGGREDLSMHIHACMLALHTGRPVKMSYGREESFFGHVHRHPSRMHFEHGATGDGTLVFVAARLLLDGGAYTSTSAIVITNASYFAAGAYEVPNVHIDGFAVFTNNPPCGAMRGFGTVQACYGVESNMDRLARALGMDPLELRIRNAASTGTVLPTGQAIDGPAPVTDLLLRLKSLPLPSDRLGSGIDRIPGGVGNVGHGEALQRGVGYAVGMKAIAYSGGQDDDSTARVRLSVLEGVPTAEVWSAAVECGQGILAVMEQIAHTELRVERVILHEPDTSLPNAGSSSASRQTWMTGGAVKGACEAVRQRTLKAASTVLGRSAADLVLEAEAVVDASTAEMVIPLVELLPTDGFEETYEFHHRPTHGVDPETGQGNAHVAFAFAAQRAVVDVDLELGLVRVVEMAVAEDVGTAINPQAVEGQIEGGVAQGLGLALLEEIQLEGGRVLNPSFTDYLLPTVSDMPPVRVELLEIPHPDSPYGVNGVGELSCLSSTPAIVNAVRAATGLELPRVPLRPCDIAPSAESPREVVH
jgi:xanthine dehydrogenase D subunit